LLSVIVIELPKPWYQSQSKTSMRVVSQRMGGILYDGPTRSHLPSWKHIAVCYMFELFVEIYYLAQSLSHLPHYTVLRSELTEFEALLSSFLKMHPSSVLKRINSHENFEDDFLLVVNDSEKFPLIKKFLSKIEDDSLLQSVTSLAELDIIRGNLKIDFGYASGQNLMRDKNGATRPRLLEMTNHPIFLTVNIKLSCLIDLVCEQYSLPQLLPTGQLSKKILSPTTSTRYHSRLVCGN
jgi:hypothetical protein